MQMYNMGIWKVQIVEDILEMCKTLKVIIVGSARTVAVGPG